MPAGRAIIAASVATLAISLIPPNGVCAFPDQPVQSTLEIIDSPMYKSPDLPSPPVEWVFPEGAKELWLKALERPEAELKCKAADAIARAHAKGVKGFESFIPSLLKILDQPEQHPAVRLAVVRALITLDARNTAPRLFQQLQTAHDDERDYIEPALARWDYRPMRSVWLSRFAESEPRTRSLVLAIRGLASVGEEDAVRPLRKLVLSDRTPQTTRLEAARALGRIRDNGLEKDAEELSAASGGMVAQLCAVRLLGRHSDPAAVQILQRLALDAQPPVAADAVERLLALDAKLVIPGINQLLSCADPRVRSLCVEALFRVPTEAQIALLSRMLDDVHPDVRSKARQSLRELAAQKERRDYVISRAGESFASHSWRGLEQAAILLAQLDHKPAATGFVKLLDSDRPEVFVAAAWGLRKLNVPETLPRVARHIEARFRQLNEKQTAGNFSLSMFDMIDHETSQLLQFIGVQRYAAADKLLRRFIPRPTRGHIVGQESRAAAIWSLGLLHEGKNPHDLVDLLVERLSDTASRPPEDFRVRWMSAVGLGRMKAVDRIAGLRQYQLNVEPNDDPINNACCWAIEQLTGKKMPQARTIYKPERDWFLIPQK
jgi:HEAT repeat protein